MSAALPVIAESATIIDWPSEPGGEPALLREGSNDWLCLPDNIGTPGNDPMCVDPTWTSWMNAFMAGTAPEITAPGISYMLAGGSDPSNYDPYATEPQEGEDWVNSGPHIMLLMPGGFDPADFSTDPLSGGPYIMWEGTPYEHLMVPVVPAAEAIGPISTSDSDEVKIENIMGGVPQMIGEAATFMDWPAEAGGDMTLLREGTNEWICVPDWPATPANDPMCFDPTYMGWMAAFMGGAEPQVDVLGVSYMLAGGAFADNADPICSWSRLRVKTGSCLRPMSCWSRPAVSTQRSSPPITPGAAPGSCGTRRRMNSWSSRLSSETNWPTQAKVLR